MKNIVAILVFILSTHSLKSDSIHYDLYVDAICIDKESNPNQLQITFWYGFRISENFIEDTCIKKYDNNKLFLGLKTSQGSGLTIPSTIVRNISLDNTFNDSTQICYLDKYKINKKDKKTCRYLRDIPKCKNN